MISSVRFALLTLGAFLSQATVMGEAPGPELRDQRDAPDAGVRRALIIIGLPGDAAHHRQFTRIAEAWQRWLIEDLTFSAENIVLLSGRQPPAADEVGRADRSGSVTETAVTHGAATRTSVEKHVAELIADSKPNDVAWVFFLGHANYDEEHAYFHLPGPDIHEGDVAAMFKTLRCREQVFWLTHTCSGWFLKPLSQPERIVMTASAADREFNETEFPVALEAVSRTPRGELDGNGDGRVSIAELFVSTATNVNTLFAADMRLATEHAQLDDNGDGVGTEADQLQMKLTAPADDQPTLRRIKTPDGQRASSTFLPGSPGIPDEPDSELKEPSPDDAHRDAVRPKSTR